MRIYTIGFTKRTAQDFFETLAAAGVSKVVDVRLRSNSQLSAFAKVPDLPYFLNSLCGIGYEAEEMFAPTSELLDAYKSKRISWDSYANGYGSLIDARGASQIDLSSLDGSCFLCSEYLPHKCHRRIAAEFLRSTSREEVEIIHL